MSRRSLLRCGQALIIALLLAAGGTAGAQLRPFGDAAAIVGARIEIGDGRVVQKGTVLVRDGLIEAVGADLTVPPDAEVIPGEGLIVFPGFIDAWWPKGLKLPEAQPNQDVPPDPVAEASPSMREANRKGVRPEVNASEFLAMAETDLAAMRKAGFTTALVAPTGGAINGTAALVNLNGLPRREGIIRPAVAMGFGFATVEPGGYPVTLLGVMAQIRQTLFDARRYRLQQAAFEKGGARRPPHDGALAAQYAALRSRFQEFTQARIPDHRLARLLAEERVGTEP